MLVAKTFQCRRYKAYEKSQGISRPAEALCVIPCVCEDPAQPSGVLLAKQAAVPS